MADRNYKEFNDNAAQRPGSSSVQSNRSGNNGSFVTAFGGENTLPGEEETSTTPLAIDVDAIPQKKCRFRFGPAVQVAVAAACAIVLGQIIRAIDPNIQSSNVALRLIGFPGELWMRALKCLVVPLVMTNMVCGISTLKQLPGSPKLGAFAITYYLFTTAVAAVMSVLWIFIFLKPWVGVIQTTGDAGIYTSQTCAMTQNNVVTDVTLKCQAVSTITVFDTILNIFYGLVPDNFVESMVSMNLTGLILCSVVVGLLITNVNEHGERSQILNITEELNVIIFKIITFLILLAPLGVFSLLAPNSAIFDIAESFKSVGLLIAATLTGHFVHAFVFYPLMFFVLTGFRRNPFKYAVNVFAAQLTAMGTSSSAATLPVSLDCAVRKNNVDPNIAKFCLSLGATINMDGTAIAFPCAACFVAYAQGINPDFGQIIVIIITSTLASIGAAPIPSSGLVMLIMILESAKIPVTSTFGLVLAIDWFIDRFATTVNITGDAYACGILDIWFKESMGPKGDTPEQDKEEMDDMFRRVSVAGENPLRRSSIIPLGEGSGPVVDPSKHIAGRSSVVERRRSRAATMASVHERQSTEMMPRGSQA